jgi:predicted nucleic acid-binding protein
MRPAVVVDASALIDLVLMLPRARAVAERIGNAVLHAPHLIDLEVAHAVRRRLRAREIAAERGEQAIMAVAGLPILRYSHRALILRVWQLRENLTAYDAAYVALAEVLAVPLLTRDARLARSAGHTARIEYID